MVTYKQMDVKFKNLVAVMTVIGLLVGAVITYYFTVGIGAISTGTLAGVGSGMSLDATSNATLTAITTDYGANVTTANAVIPIVFSLVTLVAIMLIFNFKLGGNKGGKGGVE